MISGSKAARFSAETDAEILTRAEKELAAFVAAVSTLHGEEQARVAADDWLLELMALKGPCKGASLDLDLRSVTIRAAKRLALRLSTPSPAAFQILVQENGSPRQRRGKTALTRRVEMSRMRLRHVQSVGTNERRVTQWKQSDC